MKRIPGLLALMVPRVAVERAEQECSHRHATDDERLRKLVNVEVTLRKKGNARARCGEEAWSREE